MASISNDFSTTNVCTMQRAQAREFARADKRDVANMAVLQYSIENGNNERRFNKRINRTMNALPVLAVASGLAAGKGAVASVASGTAWGLALLVPNVMMDLNNKMTAVSPRIKKAEQKHPVMTFLAGAATSIAGFMGAASLTNKLFANPKVGNAIKSAGKMVKDAGNSVKNSGFVQTMGAKVSTLAAKAKNIKVVDSLVTKVKGSEVLANVAKGAKNLGKEALIHAPELAVLFVTAAIIGKSVGTASKINSNKRNIEEAQLQVANSVIDSYEAENEELKSKVLA